MCNDLIKVHANETFPANGVYKPAQFSFNNRGGDWAEIFLVANRGKHNDTDVYIDDLQGNVTEACELPE
jgi:hypothetical protein